MSKKKKIVIVTLLLMLCISIIDKTTEFKTDNASIESIIREQADKPKGKLRKSDLNKVTKIDKVIDQEDQRYLCLFKNLEDLTMRASEYSNLDFLEKNKKLKKLSITVKGGTINNIDGLKKLEGLKELALGQANVKNIDAISQLKNLRKLTIVYSNIKDWSGLANLTNIEDLQISSNNLDNTVIKQAICNLFLMSLCISHNLANQKKLYCLIVEI